jgi:hypothetical protein
MERNKLATTKAELQRMGVLMYADLAQYNGKRVEARVGSLAGHDRLRL